MPENTLAVFVYVCLLWLFFHHLAFIIPPEDGSRNTLATSPPAQRASQELEDSGLSNNFSRPFNVLSDSNIVSFLSANPSLPVALDDMRFFRFSSDHHRLVRGLVVPLLFDQRALMIFARLHTYTDVSLDPALDKLIDSIDEASWFSYLFFLVVSPSYPIYQTLSVVSSESSFDEWFQFCFLLFSLFEGIRFCCIVYDFITALNDDKGRAGFSLMHHFIHSFQKKFLLRPALVALGTIFSYYVLWRMTPEPFFLLLSNAQIFVLPAWHLSDVYLGVKNSWNCVLKYGTTAEQLREKIKIVVGLQAKIVDYEHQISDLREKIQVLERRHMQLQISIEKEQSQSEALKSNISALKTELKACSDSALGQQLQEAILLKEQEKEKCEKSISDMMSELERNKCLQQSLEKKTADIEQRCEAQRKEVEQKESQNEELIKILKTKAIPIDKVNFIRAVGKGGCGSVSIANFFGRQVAVKFSLAENAREARESLMMEASI